MISSQSASQGYLSSYFPESLYVRATYVFLFSLASPLYPPLFLSYIWLFCSPEDFNYGVWKINDALAPPALIFLVLVLSPCVSHTAYFFKNRCHVLSSSQTLSTSLCSNFRIFILIQSFDSTTVQYSQTGSHFPTF